MIHVNVLWTAGLDSTCRIVELASQEGYIIQPWYIVDSHRRSRFMEMKRIRRMTSLIRTNPATRSRLEDVRIVGRPEKGGIEDLHELWKPLHQKYHLGSQYVWLAGFLRERGMVAEVSLEQGQYGATLAIESECEIYTEKQGEYEVYRINPEHSSTSGAAVFRDLAFPVSIWDTPKKEEAQRIIRLGYEDVFRLTWFCHKPILGLPCGHCNPCRNTIQDGLGWRVPVAGRILYYPLNPILNLINSIGRRLRK